MSNVFPFCSTKLYFLNFTHIFNCDSKFLSNVLNSCQQIENRYQSVEMI